MTHMPWTITRLCIDQVDTSCLSVCPVDCIYEWVGEAPPRLPNQLYINPDECIDCGACEPECPWQAIFEEAAVPEGFESDIALNHATVPAPSEFRVKNFEQKEPTTPHQGTENQAKWGLE